MDEKLNHIDSFFKEALQEYSPQQVQRKKAYGMWLRLFFVGLGVKSLIASLAILLTGGAVFFYFLWGGDQAQQIEQTNEESAVVEYKNPQMDTDQKDVYSIIDLQESEIIEPGSFVEAADDIIRPTEKQTGNEELQNQFQKSPTQNAESQQNNSVFHQEESNSSSSQQVVGSNESTMPHSNLAITPLSTLGPGLIAHGKLENKELTLLDSLYDMRSKALEFSLLLTLQPGLVFNQIENATITTGTETGISSDSEPFILVNGFGAEFRIQRKNWFLQTGLNYAVYGEDVTYTQQFLVADYDNLVMTVDTTWGWIYDPPNNGILWPLSVDTSFQPGYEAFTDVFQVNNRYHYLEIPLQFGFETHIKQFNCFINTGISTGFIVDQMGYLPGQEDSKIENAGSYNFRKPQFNFMIQAGLGIPLADRVQLIFEPSLKYTLNSIIDDGSYNNSHKYLVLGLHAGLIIKL